MGCRPHRQIHRYRRSPHRNPPIADSARTAYTACLQRSVLVVCLGVMACADDRVDIVYDPCSPLTIAVEDEVGEAEARGVADAVTAWQRVLPTQIAIGGGAQAPDVLPVRFESGPTFFRGIYWP